MVQSLRVSSSGDKGDCNHEQKKHQEAAHLRIDHNPRAAAQLAAAGDVDEDGLVVDAQLLHDERPRLQHALEEVALAAGEAAPVGEDEEGEALAVKLLDGLRGLVGRVGPPDLGGYWRGGSGVAD